MGLIPELLGQFLLKEPRLGITLSKYWGSGTKSGTSSAEIRVDSLVDGEMQRNLWCLFDCQMISMLK